MSLNEKAFDANTLHVRILFIVPYGTETLSLALCRRRSCPRDLCHGSIYSLALCLANTNLDILTEGPYLLPTSSLNLPILRQALGKP